MNKRASMVVAAFAIVAGLVAWGLYAMSEAGNTDEASACLLDENFASSLDDVVKGEVAAFQISDRSASVADLTFANASGEPVKFTDFGDKTVLFNLWATWCVPCRVEMPALDELQEELGGETFQVVPVSVDLGDDVKPKAFYKETGLKHLPFYHDGEIATLDTLKKQGLAFGLPTTLLAKGNGCVIGWLNGPAEWASADAKRLVKAAMQ